jgi:CRP-like cAMP-binding protein
MMANLKQIHEERRLQLMRLALQRDLLGKTPLLRDAGPALLDDLARALEVRLVDGVVFQEGDLGERFFLVGRGALHVLHGNEIVGDVSQGGYFGEGALLGGSRRSATLVTVGPAVLYELSRDAFDRVLREHPEVAERIREGYARRSEDRVRSALQQRLVRQVSFLQDADPAFLDALAMDLRLQTAPDGHVLFQEGSPGDRMYFIARGAVRISRDRATVAELTAGAYFGEMALLTSQLRSATATAIGITELLELDRAGFDRLVSQHPGVHAQLEQVRRARAEQLTSVSA